VPYIFVRSLCISNESVALTQSTSSGRGVEGGEPMLPPGRPIARYLPEVAEKEVVVETQRGFTRVAAE
jgi:hypothetical protein